MLDSDRTWAALVSLGTSTSSARIARLMEFHVQGMDNTSLYERYGDGVLPWIANQVDADGVCTTCPGACCPVSRLGHPEAFNIAARVRKVVTRVEGGFWPSPTGEAAVLCQWVVRHPEPGYRLLGERARADDDRVIPALRALHAVDPRGTRQRLVGTFDEATVVALYDRLDLHVPALPESVVAALRAAPTVDLPRSRPLPIAEIDAVLDDGTGPSWDNANLFCAAMRLTGFVHPGGTDGLLFQTLTNDSASASVKIVFYSFGFDGLTISTRWHEILDDDATSRLLELREEVTVALPNGSVTVAVEPHLEFGDALDELNTLLLALSADRATRDQLFLTPEQLVRTLGLPDSAQALFVLDDWHHPEVGEEVADSVDLVLAVEALRERRAITGSITGKSRDQHLRERLEILS